MKRGIKRWIVKGRVCMVLFSNNLLIIRGERLNETLRLHPCPKNEEKNRESTIPLFSYPLWPYPLERKCQLTLGAGEGNGE